MSPPLVTTVNLGNVFTAGLLAHNPEIQINGTRKLKKLKNGLAQESVAL